MAKASITLPNGTTIQVDGTKEEIIDIVNHVKGDAVEASSTTKPPKKKKRKKDTKTGNSTKKGTGPTRYIKELKEQGFFKERRVIRDVQRKLEEQGFIYATTSLSPALLKLTQKKVLRRIKEKSGYVYVANQ